MDKESKYGDYCTKMLGEKEPGYSHGSFRTVPSFQGCIQRNQTICDLKPRQKMTWYPWIHDWTGKGLTRTDLKLFFFLLCGDFSPVSSGFLLEGKWEKQISFIFAVQESPPSVPKCWGLANWKRECAAKHSRAATTWMQLVWVSHSVLVQLMC